MIVPMKKVTLLCLADDRERALNALQKLGVMHLAGSIENEAGDRQTVRAQIETLERLIDLLAIRETPEHIREALKLTGRELAEYAKTVIQGRDELNKAVELIDTEREQLAGWGNFDSQQIATLKAAGVHLYLCAADATKLEEIRQRDDVDAVEELWWRDNKVGFAVIAMQPLDEQELPLAFLPERQLTALNRKYREYSQMLIAIEHDLDELVASLPQLRAYVGELQGEHDLLVARDTMEAAGPIAILNGFVPDPEVPALQEAAQTEGWALSITEPSEEDRVPTLIRYSKWTKVVKPLFDFLGIMPGYKELDVSPGVLVFFSIFFGMIINDAGYGLVFLLLTLWAKHKFKDKPQAKPPLAFLTLQSSVAIVWGVMAGSYFGMEWGGLPWLTDESSKNQHIQLICFILGLVQLTMGRIWSACQQRSWRKSSGQIGWALVLGGNFLIILNLLGCAALPAWTTQLMYGLYAGGLLLVVVGSVNWLDVADVFQFPFAIIGSFVDVLSYIRLFAVGLAGYYIALNFNKMGVDLVQGNWWMVLPAAIVIFLGHALNVSLCLMSVLVHGVRLNTLEFSNHVGLTWCGVEYRPLKKAVCEK